MTPLDEIILCSSGMVASEMQRKFDRSKVRCLSPLSDPRGLRAMRITILAGPDASGSRKMWEDVRANLFYSCRVADTLWID